VIPGRRDPGPCPICGAAHHACGPGGPIAVALVPARDSQMTARPSAAPPLGTEAAPASEVAAADAAPLSFTTATYRGGLKKRKT